MTSEPDSKPGRRPPTIELKATEVDSPAPAQNTAAAAPAGEPATPNEPAPEQHAAASPSGGRSDSRLKSYAASAAVAALAIVAIGAGLWIAGVVPARQSAAPSDTPGPASGGDISARLEKIEPTIQTQHQEPATIAPALGDRVIAAEAQTKSLVGELAALNHRLDDIAAASQSAAKQAGEATAAADAAKESAKEAAKDTAKGVDRDAVQRSDIEALASRIAALESDAKTLSDNTGHQTSAGIDPVARLIVATAALRAAVERGVPYQAELAAVQALGVDQSALTPLEPFAASGVPSAGSLSRELAALTPALERATQPAPGEATFLDRLEANAQKLVRITPVDAPASSDPSTVIGRIALDAARADIATALTDIAGLPETAKPLTADWIAKAQARDAAMAASRRIATDALAALGKPASQ